MTLARQNCLAYTKEITPQGTNSSQTVRLVIIWLALILLAGEFAYAWSNHFNSGFHLDDFNTIVKNKAIRSLSSIPSYFVNPHTFSARVAGAEYEPLLSTSFAIDYAVGLAKPLLFQMESFVWFMLELLFLFLLFWVIPGGKRNSALFAAALYGYHPLTAPTLNYISQRGMICSVIGICASLLLWIVWPRMLPPDFQLRAPKVPNTEWDMLRIKMRPRLSLWYRRIVGLRFPFYILPVTVAMLAGSGAVAFVPILLAYMWIFEPETRSIKVWPRKIALSVAVCGSLWIFQTGTAWGFDRYARIPFLQYLITQPWVTLHYLYSAFFPQQLVALSDVTPFSAPWAPLALAGFAGVAVMVWLAFLTAKHAGWRGVSFGIWWFLLALLPFALVPQRDAQAYPRAFIALAGLVLAAVRAAFILLDRLKSNRPETESMVALVSAVVGAVLLSTLGWQTNQLNDFWQSDETLWKQVVDSDPNDGRALTNYALTFMNPAEDDVFGARFAIGFDYLAKAAKLLPRDADVQAQLGLACEYLGRDSDAETHFKRAIEFGPATAVGYGGYSEWLLNHSHEDEAFNAATKAVKLDPLNLPGRRTLAEISLTRGDWPKARQLAREMLDSDPDDVNAQRTLNVALAGAAAEQSASQVASQEPTVNHFLALAVINFQERKYPECILASQEALKLHPDLLEAYINIAAAWHALGKDAETVAALREALRVRPDFDLAKHNLEVELSAHPELAQAR